jgi:hypothetical protein
MCNHVVARGASVNLRGCVAVCQSNLAQLFVVRRLVGALSYGVSVLCKRQSGDKLAAFHVVTGLRISRPSEISRLRHFLRGIRMRVKERAEHNDEK